jgi:hypothetical protein
MSYDFSDSAYDDFLKDDRLGHQDFMVSAIEDGTFPNTGDPFKRLKGTLTSAGNATIDYTFGSVPPADKLKEEAKTWDDKKRKAVQGTITMVKQLVQHYGKTPDDVKVGDVFRVNVVKNKEGYVRIVAFLPASEIGQQSAEAGKAMSNVPF